MWERGKEFQIRNLRFENEILSPRWGFFDIEKFSSSKIHTESNRWTMKESTEQDIENFVLSATAEKTADGRLFLFF